MQQLSSNNTPYLIGIGVTLTIVIFLFALFFYRSVKTAGDGKLFNFTFVILAIGFALNILVFAMSQYVGLDLTDLLPLRINSLFSVFGSAVSWLLFSVFFLAFSILFFRNRSTPDGRLLKIVWIFFLCFNLLEVLLNLYSYFSWTEPVAVVIHYKTTAEKMIMEHVRSFKKENYLIYSIVPAIWSMISSISVYKLFTPLTPDQSTPSLSGDADLKQ